MDLLAIAAVVAMYVAAAKLPLWLVTGARPTDVPREWPRGVQEGEPVAYSVGALTTPSEDRVTPVPTDRVAGGVDFIGR
jgi:hypothetical protein